MLFFSRIFLYALLFVTLSQLAGITLAAVMMGGGAADTDVNIDGLSLDQPSSAFFKTLKVKNLPEQSERGMYSERLTDCLFLSGVNKNLSKTKPGYRFVRCNGKYDIRSDNGYDGFYVLLDNDDNIAMFSECSNIVKGSNREATYPIVIITESKYKADGILQFGPGINGATQMSEAWVRYVAHNILLNRESRTYIETCPITKDPNVGIPTCESPACGIVKKTILNEVIIGNRGLRRVFRLATVLDSEKNFTLCALYDTDAMKSRTEALLGQLFP